MSTPKLLCIALFLLPCAAIAQEKDTVQFGCSHDQRARFDPRPNLRFVELASADSIKQWRTRPVVPFDGFDAAKYRFTRVEFYRWHVPVPGREGADQSPHGDSTDQLTLAVRIVTPQGERWFELSRPEGTSERILYIQPLDSLGASGYQPDQSPQPRPAPEADEMTKWLTLAPASPDAKLPLFDLSYGNNDSGMYQAENFKRQLLLDLRTGIPHIVKTVSCNSFEPIGGACSAQDEAWAASDHLQCQWDASSSDFHCTMSVPYGGANAVRSAQKEFYLLSDKPVKPTETVSLLPDLGQFAVRIRENPTSPTKAVLVSGLGPATLLQRFRGLLPDTDAFVFANPGAGPVFNVYLSLVTVPAGGKPTVEAISKWGIGGEQTDEEKAPEGYMPSGSIDAYHSKIIEQRSGFRAFNLVLTAQQGTNPVHVLYWVGLEAVGGKLVANAVRLASEGYSYAGCGREFHESTASFLRQKVGEAEATVRVQGQYNSEYETPYPTEEGNCVWSGLLHWKAGAGFRVRRLGEDCKAAHREVKITDDGTIQIGSSQ